MQENPLVQYLLGRELTRRDFLRDTTAKTAVSLIPTNPVTSLLSVAAPEIVPSSAKAQVLPVFSVPMVQAFIMGANSGAPIDFRESEDVSRAERKAKDYWKKFILEKPGFDDDGMKKALSGWGSELYKYHVKNVRVARNMMNVIQPKDEAAREHPDAQALIYLMNQWAAIEFAREQAKLVLLEKEIAEGNVDIEKAPDENGEWKSYNSVVRQDEIDAYRAYCAQEPPSIKNLQQFQQFMKKRKDRPEIDGYDDDDEEPYREVQERSDQLYYKLVRAMAEGKFSGDADGIARLHEGLERLTSPQEYNPAYKLGKGSGAVTDQEIAYDLCKDHPTEIVFLRDMITPETQDEPLPRRAARFFAKDGQRIDEAFMSAIPQPITRAEESKPKKSRQKKSFRETMITERNEGHGRWDMDY